MSFTRTPSGLTNLAQFYGKDIIVFTEGGTNSYSYDEICAGKFNSAAIDIKFWASVFEKHNFDKNIEFRALGSKSASNSICEMIEHERISNVIVTRDSDLDDFLGRKYTSPYVLYTRGYSWENDVYDKTLVKRQVLSQLLEIELKREYEEIIENSFKQFKAKTSRLLRLELICRTQGQKFITGINGERFIDRRNKPKLSMQQIKLTVKPLKNVLQRPVTLAGIQMDKCSFRYCYGKLQEALAISIITYIVSSLAGRKPSNKENITMAMIERYGNANLPESDDYYQEAISRLIAA
jgi:hypothetical protein